MREIDCRGMACPQPVLTTKKALEEIEQGELILIVDNSSSLKADLYQFCSPVSHGRLGGSRDSKNHLRKRRRDSLLRYLSGLLWAQRETEGGDYFQYV